MKTKVISFRVTEDEYNALVYNASTMKLSVGAFVWVQLRSTVELSKQALAKEQKRLEAKAKRDAKKLVADLQQKRDAKKAAANGAQ
jgi:uncharacterized protein (DUF1778 family)